jgi:hypothetical protein
MGKINSKGAKKEAIKRVFWGYICTPREWGKYHYWRGAGGGYGF